MSFVPYWEKNKEQKKKYYLDHKATYLEKVECKDCKKMISRIHFNKHLLTKSHLNIVNKIKIEKVDKKAMFICPCGGRFDAGHRTTHNKPRYINYMSKCMIIKLRGNKKNYWDINHIDHLPTGFIIPHNFKKKKRNEYNSDDEYDLFRHFRL